MRAFEADGASHRTRALNAYEQFHLLRAIGPILPALTLIDLGTGIVDADETPALFADVPPAAVTAAFAAAAAAAERDDGEGWRPATKAVSLPDMLTVALAVVDANLSAYLSREAPKFRPTSGRGADFDPVAMPNGESWFWRPIEAGQIPMIAATDGVHTLWHFAKANDVLDVRAENEARAYKAAEKR